MRHGLTLAALLAASMALTAARMSVRPLAPDESRIASAAKTLAAHGARDADGRRLPIFVRADDNRWLAPLPVYATAVISMVASEATAVRWAAVIAGSLSVLLVYAVAVELFASRLLAVGAAALLLCTPAHLAHSRMATEDGIWPLPFLAAWLLAVIRFVDPESPRGRAPLAGGAAALAVSAYTQPSAPLMVPIFGAAGLAAIYRSGRLRWSELRPASAAFAIALVPLIVWFATHPSTYEATLGRWTLHQAHVRNPVLWARAASNWITLSACSGIFWDFFSPSHLFLNAAAPGAAGVFLAPIGVLIAVGVRGALRGWRAGKPRSTIDLLIVAAFVAAPLAAATFKEPRAIQRALAIAPCGALLAMRGLAALIPHDRLLGRVAGALLLIGAAVQFVWWYRNLL